MKLDDVEHLLPPIARLLVKVIGLHAASDLIQARAGVILRVPKRKLPKGEARFEELSEIMGVEAAEKLCHHFGGDIINIPTCKAAMRELLHRQVRREFDAITREHSANYAISHLAAKYRISSRQLFRIMKATDVTEPDSAQLPLL